MMRDIWASAVTLDDFIGKAEVNQDLWRAVLARASVPEDVTDRLGELPAPRHLLVLLEDWCGDAVNTVPVLARLAEAVPLLELRVVRRDEHPHLMDTHLSGTARAIPVVIVLDEDFQELGWWGSRPGPLQTWFRSPAAQAMEKSDRYRELRRWYARDRGRTTLNEVATLLEGTTEKKHGDEVSARVA